MRLASHARSYEKYKRTTIAEHMPGAHRAVFEAGDAIAHRERFDVIPCELMMPQMAGMDL